MDVPMQHELFIFSSFLPCGHRFMAQLGCLRAWLEQSFYSTSKFIESEFTVVSCALLNTSSSSYVFHLVQKVSFMSTSTRQVGGSSGSRAGPVSCAG